MKKIHPELMYELSNGVTLCPSCHAHAHGEQFGPGIRAFGLAWQDKVGNAS